MPAYCPAIAAALPAGAGSGYTPGIVQPPKRLKRDLFGEIRLESARNEVIIVRDTGTARWWLRWLARGLLRREARALACLAELPGIPALIAVSGDRLQREYIVGTPMHRARPAEPGYFAAALRIVRRMHCAGIVHNDLAKEPNFLVRPDGAPAIVDFQLAMRFRRRRQLFRYLAYEDLRHVLKHKRTYCPEALTARERRILAAPGPASRIWRASVTPVYYFTTRKLLGWADREGTGDRGESG